MWQCVRNERKPHYLMEKKIYCGLNPRQPKNLSENWRGRFAEFGQISAPVYFYACLTMSGHDGDLITEILGSLSWEHWMDGNTMSLRWSIGFKSRERGASQWHQFLRSPGAAWMLCPRRNPGATAPAQGLTMGPRISSRYLTAVHVVTPFTPAKGKLTAKQENLSEAPTCTIVPVQAAVSLVPLLLATSAT